ncbi:AAA family ATPase [Actinacidiphila acidipaludis]|uniref:ATP-binding protein n=1 Tax=Actinacidiphila acidipaludis TaxID=2873382 RepID=A0ABS7QB92_9ACTN|nr:ATP-binding protein [Streptomyces acidipaludis]MBY8880447.1 ATP-binding protein [Streptomyces acidipaludis]
MTAQGIEEVRLTAFKSFRDQVLPLAPLTTLIGRNGSGKSNALDGLEVLSRLARGEDITEALESRRGPEGAVRGGLAGCVPHGSDRFTLGCSVRAKGGPIRLDVTVQVEPEVQIVEERLTAHTAEGRQDMLVSRESNAEHGDVVATWHNGKPGRDPRLRFRGSRLLTSQLPLRVDGETPGGRYAVRSAETMISTLEGVFHLDPVPHLMRQYVPARDSNLRRTAENLSAAVGNIERTDHALFQRLVELLRSLADHEIETLAVTRSELGDVMIALNEGQLGLTPAREMSDGMLRFLAITTSLLTGGGGLDLGPSSTERNERSLMLVIEELENGLHPSQASEVLGLVRQAGAANSTEVLITTHSPALLSALDADDHEGVVVCWRDHETGASRLTRLTELDGYPAAMAAGSLGDVVTHGRLDTRPRRDRDYTEFDRLLGIG